MRRMALITAGGIIALLTSSPLHADARKDAKAQVAFGVVVAQRGLWREAIYRWERAIQIDPTYAVAYNDLAVAYEQVGLLDKAKDAYEKALALDPNNDAIRQNYEQFKEVHERSNRAEHQ